MSSSSLFAPDKRERAEDFHEYLLEYGIREKIEAVLTKLIKMDELPDNPFSTFVEAFTEHELMCRARLIFDEIDEDESGFLDRTELFKKLKADDEVETLLGRKDITGDGLPAAKAMGRLLVSLDTDAEDGMGEGMGKISWAEFEAAVKKANRPKPPTPPPQESSSSQEAAAAAAMARQAAEDMAKSTAKIAELMGSRPS